MAAGGVADRQHRAPVPAREKGRRRAHLSYESRHADLGTEIVGRHRYRHSVREKPRGEMAEHRAVHHLPVAAMHEQRERGVAPRIRPEQVDGLPLPAAIRQIELGYRMRGAKQRRVALPSLDDPWRVRHLAAIVVFGLHVHERSPVGRTFLYGGKWLRYRHEDLRFGKRRDGKREDGEGRPMQYRSWAATHPGAVRDHNEDTFVDRPDIGLWAVADGAGGHESGELAAAMIRDALERIPAELAAGEMVARVREAIAETHEALRAEAARRGPSTVIASTVAVLLTQGEHFACLWAGNSRIYLLRDGTLRRLTHDHSLVQEMVDAGMLRAEDAESHPRSNIITRAVGIDDDGLELDKITDRAQPGDRFLLCSDGLFKALAEPAVALLLARAHPEASPVDRLLHAALERNASDNVTAVAVEALPVSP